MSVNVDAITPQHVESLHRSTFALSYRKHYIKPLDPDQNICQRLATRCTNAWCYFWYYTFGHWGWLSTDRLKGLDQIQKERVSIKTYRSALDNLVASLAGMQFKKAGDPVYGGIVAGEELPNDAARRNLIEDNIVAFCTVLDSRGNEIIYTGVDDSISLFKAGIKNIFMAIDRHNASHPLRQSDPDNTYTKHISKEWKDYIVTRMLQTERHNLGKQCTPNQVQHYGPSFVHDVAFMHLELTDSWNQPNGSQFIKEYRKHAVQQNKVLYVQERANLSRKSSQEIDEMGPLFFTDHYAAARESLGRQARKACEKVNKLQRSLEYAESEARGSALFAATRFSPKLSISTDQQTESVVEKPFKDEVEKARGLLEEAQTQLDQINKEIRVFEEGVRNEKRQAIYNFLGFFTQDTLTDEEEQEFFSAIRAACERRDSAFNARESLFQINHSD